MSAKAKGVAMSPALTELRDQVYERCLQKPIQNYSQIDILKFGLIPNNNANTLLGIIQSLMDENLMKVMTQDNIPSWRAVPKEEAEK